MKLSDPSSSPVHTQHHHQQQQQQQPMNHCWEEWSKYDLDYHSLVQLLDDYYSQYKTTTPGTDDMSTTSRTTNASSAVGTIGSIFHHFHHPSSAAQSQQQQQQLWITTELLIQLHIQLEQMTLFLLQQQGLIATQLLQVRNDLRTFLNPINTIITTTHPSTPSTPPPKMTTTQTTNGTTNSLSLSSSSSHLPSDLIVTTTSNYGSNSTNLHDIEDNTNTTNWMDYEPIVHQYEDIYYDIGLHILRLYQFMDMNVTAIRKLLKKHDKIIFSCTSNPNTSGGGGQLHHTTRRKHHQKLSVVVLNRHTHTTSTPSSTTTTTGRTNTAIDSNHNYPWSPRSSTTLYNNNNNHTRLRRGTNKLSAEAYANVLLQPLLHDEGLTSITTTLEIAVQELYTLLVVPNIQQHQHHQRVLSDASLGSLDTLWDMNHNNNSNNNSSSYGSTSNTINNNNNNNNTTKNNNTDTNNNIININTTDTVSPLLPSSPPFILPISGTGNKNQRVQQLPPKQPPQQRPLVAQSARIQNRKMSHYSPSLRQSLSLRSVSTNTIFGSSSSSNNSNHYHNVIPGLSQIDSLLVHIQIARRKLQQTNGYIQLLAAPMMMDMDMDKNDDDEEENDVIKMKEESYIDHMDGDEQQLNPNFIVSDEELRIQQSQINISNVLNLVSSMLYMCNYYIVAPTSASYAIRLGGKASLSSLIIGMTPVAALISTILFSWWTNHSYKHALIFASTCSVLGNLLYAIGLPLNSIALIMLGRLLTGFGSARSINRRYICDTFPRSERTAASASFVTASAMGMAAGPAIASILHYITTDPDNVGRVRTLYWQNENAPGWFMVLLWTVFLICLIVYFEDPPKKKYETAMKKTKSMAELTTDDTTNQETKHLLSTPTTTAIDTEHAPLLSSTGKKAIDEPPIWRNIPVMITFLIYFVLKLILEAVLSSSAVLTDYYFRWDSGTVGWYLAVLGLLVLPANAVVATLAQSYDDRELIIGIQIALFVGCLCMLQVREIYHVSQYIIGTVLLVVSANALEGPNMSLLSQTIPKSWSTGIFNVGLLSTEAGTFGRAMGNVVLTVYGNDGLDHLLNRAFGTFSILSFMSIYITFYYYDYLEPWDMDD